MTPTFISTGLPSKAPTKVPIGTSSKAPTTKLSSNVPTYLPSTVPSILSQTRTPITSYPSSSPSSDVKSPSPTTDSSPEISSSHAPTFDPKTSQPTVLSSLPSLRFSMLPSSTPTIASSYRPSTRSQLPSKESITDSPSAKPTKALITLSPVTNPTNTGSIHPSAEVSSGDISSYSPTTTQPILPTGSTTQSPSKAPIAISQTSIPTNLDSSTYPHSKSPTTDPDPGVSSSKVPSNGPTTYQQNDPSKLSPIPSTSLGKVSPYMTNSFIQIFYFNFFFLLIAA